MTVFNNIFFYNSAVFNVTSSFPNNFSNFFVMFPSAPTITGAAITFFLSPNFLDFSFQILAFPCHLPYYHLEEQCQ